jgi:hypothetical protein
VSDDVRETQPLRNSLVGYGIVRLSHDLDIGVESK